MAKSKFKKGDIVKFKERIDTYNVGKGEIGVVITTYDPDGAASDFVSLNLLNDLGDFDATVTVESNLVKVIGTTIKKKKASKLWIGDIVLLDAEDSDLKIPMLTTVARKIKEIDYNPLTDVLTLSGKDFKVEVSGSEIEEKVPVVV